ncbi:Ribosomal large subunit pseudouridine synthase A [Raoultella terrigena]|uniref:Dual-specificity RNA pseudouridine synthase RluA n=1 Tax=Raoultella terrigena TaxID=577 RepID=A0A485AZQ0_RAOTE|nr:Ribosomal large subunit pseudouridine synthase A [Raoultella terrigena]
MAMENYNPPQDPWLVILYQDEHIMVVNKPSGLLSVPGRLEEHKDSVMTRVQRDFPQAESVHRLDMATSGVIVVALTKAAERELKRQFREREPKKQYVAPRVGSPAESRRSGGFAADLRLAEPALSRRCATKPARRRKPSMRCWSTRTITAPACA